MLNENRPTFTQTVIYMGNGFTSTKWWYITVWDNVRVVFSLEMSNLSYLKSFKCVTPLWIQTKHGLFIFQLTLSGCQNMFLFFVMDSKRQQRSFTVILYVTADRVALLSSWTQSQIEPCHRLANHICPHSVYSRCPETVFVMMQKLSSAVCGWRVKSPVSFSPTPNCLTQPQKTLLIPKQSLRVWACVDESCWDDLSRFWQLFCWLIVVRLR